MQSERNQAALDFENLRQTIQQLSSDKAGLEDQLLDKTKHQEIADRLTEAHTVAVERLINKQPTSLEGAAVWLDEIRRWTDDILATMTRLGCSKQDIHRIDSVAQTDLKGGPHRLTFVEEPMARFRLRLYRLQGIARRHAKRAENAPGNSKRAS